MEHSRLLARDQNSEQRLEFGFSAWKGPAQGTCCKAHIPSTLWLCELTWSQLVSTCNYSISFPVRGQPSIKVLFPKVQLQGIHPHGRCDVDPSPKITSSITSLAGPPVTVAAIST